VCVVDTPGFADTRKNVTLEKLLQNILSFLTSLKDGFTLYSGSGQLTTDGIVLGK